MEKRNKGNSTEAPFFIQRRAIPFWAFGLTSVVLLAYIYGKNFELNDQNLAISFLNTNAGLLVTTLAVTMSFALLGIQFLAQSYTPRALTGYLKDKVVYGFPIIYLALISLNLISSTMPSLFPPLKFLPYAVIGTIFSLLYLIAFIYYVINKILPETVIMEISKTMLPEAREDIINSKGIFDASFKTMKPFIILQQTLLKSVNNNDIFSFSHGLSLLFDRLHYYLEVTQAKSKSSNQGDHRWDAYYVYRFFFTFLSPLIAECLARGHEQFIIQYLWHMFRQFRRIYQYREIKELNDFWEQIDYVGNKIFNMGMSSAAHHFLSQLRNLIRVELETAKWTKEVWARDAMGVRKRSESDTKDWALTQDFIYRRIGSLRDFALIATNRKMGNLVNISSDILRETLEHALQLRDRITRTSLTHTVIDTFRKIHEESIKNELRAGIWTTGWLKNYVDKIDKRYLNEAASLTESFCKMSLFSISKGEYFEITQLGINGRFLVDDYPHLTIIILNTLEKSLNILKDVDSEVRITQSDNIVNEIKSIGEWNKKNHKEISIRIDEILGKLK